ncbi:MAG: DMT family transporter [Lachnospiraceae bacterium]|nr:DMT family transporter [Lachnospiraceae bacterium]
MTFFVRISGELPTMQKAFFRNAVAAVISFVTIISSDVKFRPAKENVPDLFMRSLCGTIGLICNFYAIDRLNIADANILNKLSPFFAIIMSAVILKEKANKTEWFCVIVAFIGALCVIKPSFQMQSVYAMIGMLGGLGAGAAYTFVRKLGKNGVPGPVIVLCFSVFSCLVSVPFMIINFVPMTLKQLILLLLAGISAACGQFSITKAYTKAPAREISVFDYTQVVFAALLGFLFLDQIPDQLSFLGYAIIIGSAVFKWAYMNRKQGCHE